MQFRKMMLVLTALGAMSGFMVGCGDDDKGSDTCTTNADCAGTEICHPTSNVCVATCSSASDCPDTAKTCAPLGGSGADAAKNICKCSTDVLCNGGTDSKSTDLVCSNLDRVCVTKCSSNADCGTGRTCNTGSGQCEQGGGGNPGGTCTGEGQSTCSYGQFCSSSRCTPAPVAPTTCENFTSNRPSWDPASSTGPVIYQVSRIRYETRSSNCAQGAGADDAFIVSVRAYRADADWPVLAGWPWFFLNYGGNEHINLFHRLLYGGLVPQSYKRTPANFKDAEFQFYLCSSTRDSSDSQAGFFFANGNPVCLDLTR
jgi:hypothetical protein